MGKTVVNEVDGFFIMQNHKTISLEDLAKKLKLKKEIIRKYIDERIDTATVTQTKPVPEGDDVTYHLMKRVDNRGVTIMTPAASERGDNNIKQVSKKEMLDRSGYVHRPKK